MQLQALLSDRFHLAGVGLDSPVMDCGPDSNDLPSFVEALNIAYSTLLPQTFVLESGTLRVISNYLVGTASTLAPLPARLAQAQAQRVMLRSSVGRWPGAAQAPLLWPLTISGGDAIVEVPAMRWPTLGAPVSTRHGGFLFGAQRFDCASFSISPAEVRAMDPQQRLLLEMGYEAIHGGSLRCSELLGLDMGVFVGLMNTDYASLTGNDSLYAATGTQLSIASGRISFALGMQGPCASIDTACSSSLVAVHMACNAIKVGDCETAIVSGADLLLSPFSLQVDIEI
jgi:acyl transferase domain-containing protein